MPQGFEPYLPLPRGDGLAAEKGFLLRGWAQGKDGPGLPFPGAPQARLVELPLVVGVFRSGPLSPSSEWADLPADEKTPKGRTTPISGRREVSAPRNHETGLTSAVLLSLGGVLTVIPRNSQDPQLLASHCGRPVH